MITLISRRGMTGWLIALAMAIAPISARADTPPDAKQFINSVVGTALKTLASTTKDEAKRERDFSNLLGQNFDIPRIARFVLGRYWSGASEQDKKRFVEIYREFVIKSYAAQFSEYGGETVRVTNAHPESADITIVNSEIIHPNGDPPVRVTWRVHKDGATYKIVDVDVEGVSMLLAQREEFGSVIQRNGGTIAGLIQAIQHKMQGGDVTVKGG